MKKLNQEEPRCVQCSTSFYFRDAVNPYGHKCPRILQCGHSICEGCLTNGFKSNGSLTCPSCAKISETKKLDTTNFKKTEMLTLREDFPINVYAVGQVSLKKNKQHIMGDDMITFVHKKKNMSQQKTVTCKECAARQADCSCRQCEVELCNSCFSTIHDKVTLRNHEKVPLILKETMEFFKESMCKIHSGAFLSIFCRDCKIYICKECAVKDSHLEHCCVDTFNLNEEKLPEFSELFDEVNDVLKHLLATKKLQKQEHGGGSCDEETEKVVRQVQVHYNYLHGLLQRQEEELLNKIRGVSDSSKTSLAQLNQELDNNLKEVEDLLTLSNDSLKTYKIREFPLNFLIEKLRNVTATPCHLVLDEGDSPKFELDIDPNITEALANHCSVTVPSHHRMFKLCSKDDLPESYTPEDLKNQPNPFLKPDLKFIKSKDPSIVTQKKLMNVFEPSVSPTPSQMSNSNKSQAGALANKGFPRNNNNFSGSTHSLASHESFVDRLKNIEPLAEDTVEMVQVSHLISPNNFYVQRSRNIQDIARLRAYFSKNANRSKTLPATIHNAGVYLVHYSQDNCWYRGRIVRTEGDMCEVYYVDYGNVARVPKKSIRTMSEKYFTIPDQAIHCSLNSCTPIGGNWSREAVKLFSQMTNNKELAMYIERKFDIKNNLHEVHLQFDGSSLTDALIYNGYATRVASTADFGGGLYKLMQEIPRIKTFKNIPVKEKDDFTGVVTYINVPTHFYLQKITDAGAVLKKLKDELDETYNRKARGVKVFTPVIGLPVAAKFEEDDCWYRAIIIDTPEARNVQVKFVDYGNISMVNINDIRVLEEKFLRTAAQAMKCSLHEVEPRHSQGWPTSAKAAFEKLVNDKLLRVYVEKVGRDENSPVSVVLYDTLPHKQINISGTLVKTGHALSTGQTSAQAEYACAVLPSDPEAIQSSDNKSTYSESSGVSKAKSNHSKDQKTRKDSEKGREMSVKRNQSVQPDYSIDNRIKVALLKVVSPAEIYISLGNSQKQIAKLVKEMTEFYKSDNKEEERDWNVQDICAVLNPKDDKWYRGVITETSHTNFKVYIKDTVALVEANKSMLRTLEEKFFSVPDGSHKVHLGSLKVPAGLKMWPSSTSDYLRLQMEESEALYIEKLGDRVTDSLPVRLWRKTQRQGGALEPVIDVWCDVNESLVNLGFALWDRPTNELMLHDDGSDDDTSYVQSWLENSFQGINEEEPKDKTQAVVAAEAPYVSEVENVNIKPKEIFKPPRDSVRSTRANRGRCLSQRAAYIPATIGLGEIASITKWTPAVPFKKLSFVAKPTYVDYECNIYIQDSDSAVGSTLELLEKAFISLYDKSEKRPYDEEYAEGQICIAYYEVSKKWYRAQVIKAGKEDAEVLFVDYGNTETLNYDQLRKQVTMGHIPIQCHRCKVEGIYPVSPDHKWPVRVLDFIHGSIVEQHCEVNLQEPTDDCEDYILIDLKLPCGQDLWETLLSMHYATYFIDAEKLEDDEEIIQDLEIQRAHTNNSDSKVLAEEIMNVCSSLNNIAIKTDNPLLSQDHISLLRGPEETPSSWYEVVERETNEERHILRYKDLILPDSIVEVNVQVLCVVAANSVKIMITECDDPEVMEYITRFQKMEEQIQEEVDLLPMVADPVKDMACLGCFTNDDVWYRAIIKEVTPDNEFVNVYYVDYGNSESIPTSRLRDIKAEWTEVPVQAIQVKLHNVTEGPNFERELCSISLSSCFKYPPYVMAIEKRFPCFEVELYNSDGEPAYKPLLDGGILSRE
ncbi:RING finger protein 17-like isoform X2 [Macrosteles quadrilineatus]|uniref:RING finger protein 17-like isoform X2 n=1 Tax=Macrosteles quadrilineatus TaxID=74068 RepID=UPI0023E1A5BB|nr:RING finger protein 17-like isoform X2 [Macrosteles quadrilineatus]